MPQNWLPGDIRDRIRDLCRSNNLKQSELAHAIGIDKSTFSRFMSGKTDKLSDTSLQKIAQQPPIRELERIETLNTAIKPELYSEYLRHNESPAWQADGFMIAEFRLSIFAPTLACKGRASAKKLTAAAEQL